MQDFYHEIFTQLPKANPDPALKAKILREIARLEYRALMLRRAVFGMSVFASIAALIPAFSYMLGELSTSGFGQYVSLFFSDTDYALANWSDFFYLLAESFPIIGGVLVLCALFMFFATLNQLLRYRPFDYSSYRFN